MHKDWNSQYVHKYDYLGVVSNISLTFQHVGYVMVQYIEGKIYVNYNDFLSILFLLFFSLSIIKYHISSNKKTPLYNLHFQIQAVYKFLYERLSLFSFVRNRLDFC